ncbi:kinase-like domain-containing protein [Lentinula lateritia]|uniref:Kinase-like domain-containing protein n=1 Tax=Lentinula lateritia TaxID=40482 RepID=A0ABQ8VUS0_9AGAR|nr:kinase-like domain-containing protein [Lentinula lateritia]
MSVSWDQRKTRLQELLKSSGDEDEDGLGLDRLLHGQNVIGKTVKTAEVDEIRFQDRDLQVLGTLEYGQYGVIDVVTCKLDSRVYIRKSIEKKFALRTREQCSPQFERDILLKALRTQTSWVPHLLCAFHTPTHLNLVMDYAEGGTLWDVLESSPLEGRISEDDLRWWAPQIVSAIHWCHSQGFVHRDVKPHNFVITQTAHILLIDFGTAAPVLPPSQDGSRLVPKQYCLVPCGTCDYISPEILKAHEQALVALEVEDSQDPVLTNEDEVYGLETDWWSLGAMLYEMAYGVAPFFADDIRRTYLKIMDHQRSLKFNVNVSLSVQYQDFLRRLLTDAEFRLGRRDFAEITNHPFFVGVDWHTLPQQTKPSNLHLPQFTYSIPEAKVNTSERLSEEFSQPFAFSALFQSSAASSSPGLSIFHDTPSFKGSGPLSESSTSATSFIGFSWGPTKDAFPDVHMTENAENEQRSPTGLSPAPLPKWNSTPRPLRIPSAWLTPTPQGRILPQPSSNMARLTTPSIPSHAHAFSTPVRPTTDLLTTPYYAQTLPRSLGSNAVRRTVTRRAVSDREAMKQLVDCIGMSARKKVLESGRKPRILTSFANRTRTVTRRSSLSRSSVTSTIRKELRFVQDADLSSVSSRYQKAGYELSAHSSGSGVSRIFGTDVQDGNGGSESGDGLTTGSDTEGDTSMGTYSEAPPSPSPSPRPGSAMSMMSMISKRSGTPTLTSTFSQRLGGTPSITSRSYSNSALLAPAPSISLSNPGTSRRNRSGSGHFVGRAKSRADAEEPEGFLAEHLDGHSERISNEDLSKISNGRSQLRRRTTTSVTISFEHETLDELELKHAAIMEDISVLEKRLGRFRRSVA